MQKRYIQMNFNELMLTIQNLSASFCRQTVSNENSNFRIIHRIRHFVNSIDSENPAIYLDVVDSINQGINDAFDRKYITDSEDLFISQSYAEDYKSSIQTFENLYSKFDKKHDPYITEFHIEPKENKFDSLGLLLDPFRYFLETNITVYRNNDIKERTVIADTLRPGAGISELYKINKELLLKTEYLYIQKQLERQIYNFKHEPADLYNQRFNAITENNLKEITKSLKGRDLYSLNDENKLQEIGSIKALRELLYQCHIKELNSPVILKDKKDSRAPSVEIDDEVRFKMMHLIVPFEQKIKNDLGCGSR